MTRFPILFCVLALGMASCAEIPTAELTAYKQAFGSAKQAAETILADYSNALQEATAITARSQSSERSPFPEEFDPQAEPARLVEVVGRLDVRAKALVHEEPAERLGDRHTCKLGQPGRFVKPRRGLGGPGRAGSSPQGSHSGNRSHRGEPLRWEG